MSDNCQETIMSEDTIDFLIYASVMTPEILSTFQSNCYQRISSRYFSVYTPLSSTNLIPANAFSHGTLPRLYTEMSTTALEVTGITRLSNQPVLQLKGQGVIIGIADSGIDYTHPAFLDENGKTRILSIWDQTVSDGTPPKEISYGTEYSEADINYALTQPNPLEYVKTTDSGGHGTFLAGVAGGSANPVYDFVGAAPQARFVIVKLKPAKQFFRDYYFVDSDTNTYQENDVMLGINYLRQYALEQNLPLSIAFGLGSGLGGHSGFSSLDNIVSSVSFYPNACICVPVGNEGNSRNHYRGIVLNAATPDIIEIYVNQNVDGLVFEIWGQNPAVLSIAIESPTGERITKIPARLGQLEEVTLVFEQTTISVYYELVEAFSGDEVIFVRMIRPTEGLWRILVYSNMDNSIFDSYLPGQSLIGNNAYFLRSDPDITLTSPSSTANAISVSGYDPITGAFYQDSGRGFTRLGSYKPDLCAPCTDITGPNLRGGYEQRSGTSLAAALTAGACAQFFTWAVTNGNFPSITSNNIKAYLIRGAVRNPDIQYPSRLWGYGTLDVYRSFDVLRRGGES